MRHARPRRYARAETHVDSENARKGKIHLDTRDILKLSRWHEAVTLLFADIKVGPGDEPRLAVAVNCGQRQGQLTPCCSAIGGQGQGAS